MKKYAKKSLCGDIWKVQAHTA